MEVVAWVAGEPHSDHPACACPTLTRFCIALNDRMTDEERQLLKPFVVRLVSTRSTPEVERRRAFVLTDAAVREVVPLRLEARGWKDLADELRSLPEIVDVASARGARE